MDFLYSSFSSTSFSPSCVTKNYLCDHQFSGFSAGVKIGPRMKILKYLEERNNLSAISPLSSFEKEPKLDHMQSLPDSRLSSHVTQNTSLQLQSQSENHATSTSSFASQPSTSTRISSTITHVSLEKQKPNKEADSASSSSVSKRNGETFQNRLSDYLRTLYSKEDGIPYIVKLKSDNQYQVECQICNSLISLGETHRGWSALEEHVQTSRHRLNLTLVSDLLTLDEKLQHLLDAHPGTFVLPIVNGKKSLKCRSCNKFFSTESKLWHSNVLQHLDGSSHKKRPAPATRQIDSFFAKKPKSHKPVSL